MLIVACWTATLCFQDGTASDVGSFDREAAQLPGLTYPVRLRVRTSCYQLRGQLCSRWLLSET